MIRQSITSSVTLVFAASLAGFVHAQPVEPGAEGILADLLSPKPGEHICFARGYDDAHMKAHPVQQVRWIGFRLAYYAHDPDEYYPKGQRNYYFLLGVTLRDGNDFLTAGECVPGEDGKTIRCGVDDDGGGVLIRQTADKELLLIDLQSTGRIRMNERLDDDAGIVLEPGRDDKTFLLSGLPADRCPAYEDW